MPYLLLALLATLASTPASAADTPVDCGPFLLQPGTRGMTVVIDHETPVTGTLTYQRADGKGRKHTVEHAEPARHHLFVLEDLLPGVRYRYRILGAGHDSGEHEFRTLPEAPGTYRFIALGDVRSRPDVWRRVAGRIHRDETEALFIVGTGDYPADGRQYSQWIDQFFEPGRDLLAGMPLWPAIGNHERTRQYVSDPPAREAEASHFFSLFELPGNERWYRVDYQYLTLLVLDSNSQMGPGHEQYEWLRQQLRAPRHRYTVAAFHHDPVTSGPHGRLLSDGTMREWPLDQARRFLMPLFEHYGVDLVLNGHDHIYERSEKDGVYYVVTGGGGAPLYEIDVVDNPYQQVAHSANHYVGIDVAPSSLTLSAIGVDGELLDWFVIAVKERTVARLSSTWREALLTGLGFEKDRTRTRVRAHNPLGFEVEVAVTSSGGSDRRTLQPGDSAALDVALAVPDSLLRSPAWRGRVVAPTTVRLRGDGDGILLSETVEQSVLVREARFEVSPMPAPVVDGAFDEWPAGPAMVLDHATRTILHPELYAGDLDLRATLRAGWSATGLHLALSVEDDAVVVSPGVSAWQNDGVELYLDGRPEETRAEGYGPGVAQLILALRGGPKPEGNHNWEPDELEWAVRERPGGWDLEATMPFERIRGSAWTPKAGDSLRFDAMLNDRDALEGGQTHHRLWSTGSASSNTSGYGLLILGG